LNNYLRVSRLFSCFVTLVVWAPLLHATCTLQQRMSGQCNQPASATANPSSGPAALLVSFTASPPIAGDVNVQWTFDHWDFGDGNTSTVLQATHTYTAAGSYTATATFDEGPPGDIVMTATPSVVVTVGAPLPSLVSIAVSPANPSIAAGAQQQFVATGTYSDGTTKDLTSTATWSSSDGSVATINSSGLAATVAQGTITITATLGLINGSTTLTVTAPSLVTLAVTPADVVINSGSTLQFAATGTYSDGSTQDLTSSVTWASSSTSAATIDGSGLASAVGAGKTMIGAVSGGISDSTLLTVAPPLASITSLTLSPSTAVMIVGGTRTLSVADQNGNTVVGAAWNVDNTAVVTLSLDDPPVLTAVNPGTAHITASISSISAQATVNVVLPSAGGGLPPGTVIWSVAPALGSTPSAILQAVPTSGNTPDLFAVDNIVGSGGSSTIHGLTGDGKKLWQTVLNQQVVSPAGFGLLGFVRTVPDSLGGTITLATNGNGYSFRYTLTKIDGNTGLVAWRYDSTEGQQSLDRDFAISGDGRIYTVENFFDTPGITDGHICDKCGFHTFLTVLDGQTGNVLQRAPLPAGHFKWILNGSTYEDLDIGAQPGRVAIQPDGSATVEVFTNNETQIFDNRGNPVSDTSNQQLFFIALRSDNPSTNVTLQQGSFPGASRYNFYTAGETLPDGQGGVLATWGSGFPVPSLGPSLTHVTHFDAAGNRFDYTIPGSLGTSVLGDNNTLFTNNGNRLVAFDVSGGAPLWTQQAPPNGQLALVAASTDGGVVAKNITPDSVGGDGGEQIVNFDTSGNPTYDASLSAGTTGLDYWTLGTYLGLNGVFQQVMGPTPFQVAVSPAPHPNGGSRHQNGDNNRPELLQFVGSDISPPFETLANYQRHFKQTVPVKAARSEYFLGDTGTVPVFQSAVMTPMDVVSFIGHAYELPGCSACNPPYPIRSVGLWFGKQVSQAQLGKWALERKSQPDDYPHYWPAFPSITTELDHPIQTRAPVIFIGSCRNNLWFEQLWDISDSTKYRALIVPSGNSDVDLGVAFVAWKEIARSLAVGYNVNDAVSNGNKVVQQTNFVPCKGCPPVVKTQWEVIGGKDSRGNYIKWAR
jgi:hypothetical protein